MPYIGAAAGALVGLLEATGTAAQIGAVFAGEYTCALMSTGNVRCWGNNHRGSLGLGHTNDIGDAQLAVVWTDPDFDAAVKAVYYVRVLEIPTPRWSTYDAVKLGVEENVRFLGYRQDVKNILAALSLLAQHVQIRETSTFYRSAPVGLGLVDRERRGLHDKLADTAVVVEDGMQVSKGDVLFRIDDTTQRAEVARLEASDEQLAQVAVKNQPWDGRERRKSDRRHKSDRRSRPDRRAEERRKGFEYQQRMGLDGRVFQMFKFRTMHDHLGGDAPAPTRARRVVRFPGRSGFAGLPRRPRRARGTRPRRAGEIAAGHSTRAGTADQATA